jgi:hypothetical protein
MGATRSRQPGDVLLARFAPDAVGDERADALRHLEGFVEALLEIATRLERESAPAPPDRSVTS